MFLEKSQQAAVVEPLRPLAPSPMGEPPEPAAPPFPGMPGAKDEGIAFGSPMDARPIE